MKARQKEVMITGQSLSRLPSEVAIVTSEVAIVKCRAVKVALVEDLFVEVGRI